MNLAELVRLPKPEIRGAGEVAYRCAGCGVIIGADERPIFSDGSWVAEELLELNSKVRTYHQAHAPEGPTNGG